MRMKQNKKKLQKKDESKDNEEEKTDTGNEEKQDESNGNEKEQSHNEEVTEKIRISKRSITISCKAANVKRSNKGTIYVPISKGIKTKK